MFLFLPGAFLTKPFLLSYPQFTQQSFIIRSVIIMSSNTFFHKLITILAGIALAALFTLPYFLFREQIQEYAALGYLGLFLSCAIANASVFVPASSTLFVVSAALVLNPWLCILFGGTGTALGEQVSYLCGRIGSKNLDLSSPRAQQVQQWMNKSAPLTVFIFAFLPLPLFDVVGIAAGVMRMAWWKYALAAVLGKVMKFALSVAAIFWFVPWFVENFPHPAGQLLQQALQMMGIALP